MLKNVLGDMAEANDPTVHEIPADVCNYDGQTQSSRAASRG